MGRKGKRENSITQYRLIRIALQVGLTSGSGTVEVAHKVASMQGLPVPATKAECRAILAAFKLDPKPRTKPVDPRHGPVSSWRNPRPQLSSEDFYRSPEWRAVRYQALKLHGARCQCCGMSPAQGKVMHVDHIKPRSKYPHLELTLSNLQVLCEDCNMGKSNVDATDWRRREQEAEDVFLAALDKMGTQPPW